MRKSENYVREALFACPKLPILLKVSSLTKSIINRNFTEFILQNANLPSILLLKNVVDKGGLSGSQKSGNDGNGGQVLGVRCSGGHGCRLLSFCLQQMEIQGEGCELTPPFSLGMYVP